MPTHVSWNILSVWSLRVAGVYFAWKGVRSFWVQPTGSLEAAIRWMIGTYGTLFRSFRYCTKFALCSLRNAGMLKGDFGWLSRVKSSQVGKYLVSLLMLQRHLRYVLTLEGLEWEESLE